ncbi:16S rRNA (guanine(527)-N(7))-methyltransferase RsmG [Desulfolucanica intricata]|uniref:16S rRNA (guanine(527)-N(7))-methyltransferase RsmG n=1 Tax=Desulfolucanica intricata TaxID=1285191 RepID=UPI0008317DC4|nr:16S rRNA (guanine(527)-N(7))-methyltransferase RsmG [Desulfolucanica intricata]
MKKYLLKGVKEFNIYLSGEQIQRFEQYYQLLLAGNEQCNLTAITGCYEVVTKHFLDSLSCIKVTSFDGNLSLLDVGTGAGFPGIPLKILKPDLSLVLLDSLQKRINFLNRVAAELTLKNVKVHHSRAEDAGHRPEFRENFDRVTARAVAHLAVLAEYCLPMVKINGIFVAQKGPMAEQEINEAKKAITILGGEIKEVYSMKLPLSGEERTLIAIKKISPTPDKYPRRAGIPAKKPLK